MYTALYKDCTQHFTKTVHNTFQRLYPALHKDCTQHYAKAVHSITQRLYTTLHKECTYHYTKIAHNISVYFISLHHLFPIPHSTQYLNLIVFISMKLPARPSQSFPGFGCADILICCKMQLPFTWSHLVLCAYIYIYILYIYTGWPRRNGHNFGRVYLRLNYTDITQNTYIQSWTVTGIMAREFWNFDSRYTLIDYEIHIKTGRNMWFL